MGLNHIRISCSCSTPFFPLTTYFHPSRVQWQWNARFFHQWMEILWIGLGAERGRRKIFFYSESAAGCGTIAQRNRKSPFFSIPLHCRKRRIVMGIEPIPRCLLYHQYGDEERKEKEKGEKKRGKKRGGGKTYRRAKEKRRRRNHHHVIDSGERNTARNMCFFQSYSRTHTLQLRPFWKRKKQLVLQLINLWWWRRWNEGFLEGSWSFKCS